jgi:transcriptional regulator with XRE-family HTH domain
VSALIVDFVASLATGMVRIARSAGASLRFAETLLLTPEQLRLLSPRQRALMRETGLYLRDLREVAGLTLSDLTKALDLEEQSLIEAIENGTATLSFELILRLAALLARHDPLPLVMRAVRAYHPDLWKALEGWGASQLPVQFERERQFLNLYRRYDQARRLSDRGFDEVLRFTQAAFELALHFALEHEGRPSRARKKRKRR